MFLLFFCSLIQAHKIQDINGLLAMKT